jgi:hypothetical protein
MKAEKKEVSSFRPKGFISENTKYCCRDLILTHTVSTGYTTKQTWPTASIELTQTFGTNGWTYDKFEDDAKCETAIKSSAFMPSFLD